MIQDIPDDILIKILSLLSPKKIIDIIPKVCVKWHNISQNEKLWKNITLSIDDDMIDDDVLKFISCCPVLSNVILHRSVANIVLTALYTNCKLLNTIHFHETQKISSRIFNNLVSQCCNISNISIPNSWLQHYEIIESIGMMNNLEVFSIEMDYCYGLSHDMKLKPLADGCPKLLKLDLSYSNVERNDLIYFLGKKSLRSLTVSFTIYHGPVTPHLEVCASTLNELYLLNNSPHEVHASSFKAIRLLSHLSCLCIDKIGSTDPKVIAGIFDDGSLPKLKKLILQWENDSVLDCVLRTVSLNCPLLEVLIINQSNYSDEPAISNFGFQLMPNLENFNTISLFFKTVPNYLPLEYLSKSKSLQKLSIDICSGYFHITNELNGFIHLKYLKLIQCDVTDLPLLEFPKIMPMLRTLKFIACYGLDRIKLNSLQQVMPYLNI